MASAYLSRKVRLASGQWVRRTARRTGEGVERHTDVRWEVRFRLGGRGSKPRSAGSFRTRAAAESRLRAVEADLAEGRVPRRGVARDGERTMADAVARFIAASQDRAPQTLRNYDQALRYLGDFGAQLTESLHWADFQAWSDRNRHLKASTRRIYLDVYRNALDHAEVEPNPARHRNIRLGSAKAARVRPPTWEQMRAIERRLETPVRGPRPSRYLLPVMFIKRTGMRINEALDLRCGDVDEAAGWIDVSQSKRRTAGERYLPITRELAPVIEALSPGPRLPGEPLLRPGLTDNSVYKALMRASAAEGLEATVGPHDLRHRFLSRLVQAGVPWPMVRYVAGHSNMTSLQRTYAHVLMREPAEELNALKADVMTFFSEVWGGRFG